jgi:hypothetical protein
MEIKKLTDIDDLAHDAATSPLNDGPEPLDEHKQAGMYKKGHLRLCGLDIAIENPAGSRRRPEWPPMKSHYGYIKGTIGKDKDHLDIFIKPGTDIDYVGPFHIVDQLVEDSTDFDEHKIMLGWPNTKAAMYGYLENYTDDWNGLGTITEVHPDVFKDWLENGDTKQPYAYKEPITSAAKTFNEKHALSWWSALSYKAKREVFQYYIPNLDALLHDRYTGKFKKPQIEISVNHQQDDFDKLVMFLVAIRGLGSVKSKKLFKTYRTKKELTIGSKIDWHDPDSPISFWNADPVAAFLGSSNVGVENVMTLVQFKPTKKNLLCTNELLLAFIDWFIKNTGDFIKPLFKDYEQIKVQTTRYLRSSRNVVDGRKLSIIYLDNKTKNIQVEVVGSFNSSS